MQVFATVLTDVCYRLYAEVGGVHRPGQVNARHHLQDLFNRRLARGQCHRTPCLGWSEFTCSYWGPFRTGVTEVDDAFSEDVPSMLVRVWDAPTHGQYVPKFDQDLAVVAGVLTYDRASSPEREGTTGAQ